MLTTGIDALSTGQVAGSTLLSNDKVTSDQFLQLLVTQLRNQDPLEPLSSEDFMAQLAQFQSLEELMQINASSAQTLLSQRLSAASALMGRYVAGISDIFGVVEGVVERVYVDGADVYLDVGGLELRVDEVLEVSEPETSEDGAET